MNLSRPEFKGKSWLNSMTRLRARKHLGIARLECTLTCCLLSMLLNFSLNSPLTT